MKINRKLVWDYQVSDEDLKRPAVAEWYVSRVLARGGIQDIRDLGLKTIQIFLPRLFLPKNIHDFWRWYFTLPANQARDGHSHVEPENFSA
ncbi:MAG TPA: hypothetical protein VJC08_02340 [bacterium]|nr:hypothetical protein [bacterium]